MIRAMMSEWLQIMLEEIARKQAAAEAAAQEEQRRRLDRAGGENRGAGQTTG
jgi:hypothetical protein